MNNAIDLVVKAVAK